MPYAIIGDVVDSRRFASGRDLVDRLTAVLVSAADPVEGTAPLRVVVRDEFHGLYPTARLAVEAALRARLAAGTLVLPTVEGEDEPVDVRVGIGHGDAEIAESGTPIGAAWWHARDARDAAQELPGKTRWPPSLRSVCRSDDPVVQSALGAYLLLQDQLFARMDARDRRALLGLLDGERQVDIAAELGVTQPAIARRVKERGALAIVRALAELDHLPP